MGNSTISLQMIVDHAKTMPNLNPVLAVGGFSAQPALTIANDVIAAILSQAFNFKWNRMKLPIFFTNSLQQDYALNLNNLAWLEHGIILDINSTVTPKNMWVLETNRDLEMSSFTYSRPGQASWLPNDQLVYGTWAANSTYLLRIGVPTNPLNPLNQIQDPNGNFWVVSNSPATTVKTGAVQPTWPTSPVYPTFANPNVVATTVLDGTVLWRAVNPKGQGIRLNPIPPQTGIVYQIYLIGQMRPPVFTTLQQTLEPIPDDFAPYFRRGFIAYTYMHSNEAQVRAKFQDQYQLWMQSLADAARKSDRERDNMGLFPSEGIMTSPWTSYVGPANPFYPSGF